MKKIIVYLIFVFVFTNCKTVGVLSSGFENVKKIVPPGMIRIDDNLFYDVMEVTNIDYLEYLYWIKYVFGEDSPEYKSAYPDTSVWKKYGFEEKYFDNYKYHSFPVVGVTLEQARDYASWRADRITEMILIEDNKIKINPNQNKDMYFSIENYFSGKYMDYKPDVSAMYYPEIRIPVLKEYRKALDFDLKSPKKVKDYVFKPKVYMRPIKESIPVHEFDINAKNFQHLMGNVRELLNEGNISVGGSWNDEAEEVLKNDIFPFDTPDAMTGFRCVASWKKWK